MPYDFVGAHGFFLYLVELDCNSLLVYSYISIRLWNSWIHCWFTITFQLDYGLYPKSKPEAWPVLKHMTYRENECFRFEGLTLSGISRTFKNGREMVVGNLQISMPNKVWPLILKYHCFAFLMGHVLYFKAGFYFFGPMSRMECMFCSNIFLSHGHS